MKSGRCPYDYVPSVAAVPAIRAAFGDKSLSPETDAAPSSIPGDDGNNGFIQKSHNIPRRWKDAVILVCVNAYPFFVSGEPLKGDRSVDLGEKSIISPQTHIFTGVYFGALLPDQYIIPEHLFLPQD